MSIKKFYEQTDLHCNDQFFFVVDHLSCSGMSGWCRASMFQVGDFWELAKHVFDEVITRPWLLNSQSEQSSRPRYRSELKIFQLSKFILTFTCLPPRIFWHVFEKNRAARCAAIALGSLWTPVDHQRDDTRQK